MPSAANRATSVQPSLARFAELGLAAVNYGPGDPSLAHSAGEHVPLAQIAECEAKLRAWLSG